MASLSIINEWVFATKTYFEHVPDTLHMFCLTPLYDCNIGEEEKAKRQTTVCLTIANAR